MSTMRLPDSGVSSFSMAESFGEVASLFLRGDFHGGEPSGSSFPELSSSTMRCFGGYFSLPSGFRLPPQSSDIARAATSFASLRLFGLSECPAALESPLSEEDMVGGYFSKTQDLAFRGGTEGRGQLLARHVLPADEHISLVVKIEPAGPFWEVF